MVITEELGGVSFQKAISSEGLKELYNIQTELHMFTEQYCDRLINLLRQHHMMD